MPDDRHPTYCLPLLPWLYLASEIDLGRARVVPVHVEAPERTLPDLASVRDALVQVLSSFRRSGNHPIRECATLLPTGWEPRGVPTQRETAECRRLADLLMLATFAENDYGVYGGSYVNGRVFDLYTVQFTSPPGHVPRTYRRRDGHGSIVGARFGQSLASVPPEAEMHFAAHVGLAFARALGSLESEDALVGRLRLALPLFRLANTDSDLVMPDAEFIVLAAAFDALLGTQKAEAVASEVADLLDGFTGIVASDPRAAKRSARMRPAVARSCRPLRRVWAHEFYDRRNMLAHGRDADARSGWAWEWWEHLAMGSFVFPLLVKIMLARGGRYELTPDDKAKCDAVDMLLAETGWFFARNVNGPEDSLGEESVWAATLNEARRERSLREAEEISRRFFPQL